MAEETLLQDATLSQLTEILVSKSDQIYLHLERLSSHSRGTPSHTVGDAPLGLQHIGKPEPKHPTSSCELTNTLWTAISRISSSINETRPTISRLPPEILAEIFGWHQYLESKQYRWYTWVRLMLVSRGWRSTILSFPFLWSTVWLSGKVSPEIILTLFERSGGHPLDVIIPHPRYPPISKSNRNSLALEASLHVSRIRKFRLGYDGSGMNYLIETFSKPAPNLTYLKLCVFGPKMSFPNLFGLEFPKLVKLEVRGVEAWPKVVGANLTWIRIDCYLNPHLLSRCIPYSPNLKVLKLLDIWDFDEPDPSTWQRIALPPGARLTIKYSSICPRILALFSLPQDCRIKLGNLAYIGHSVPSLSYVLPDDIAPFKNLRTLTRLHITARFNIEIRVKVKCYRLDRPAFEVNVGFSPEVPALVEPNNTPMMWFLVNLHQIVLREVEELRMEGFAGPLEPQTVELLEFLKRMPGLTRLITTDNNEETLCSALDSLGCRAVVVRAEG